eukprot:6172706-Pleurochrysis_carterae.AAC.1
MPASISLRSQSKRVGFKLSNKPRLGLDSTGAWWEIVIGENGCFDPLLDHSYARQTSDADRSGQDKLRVRLEVRGNSTVVDASSESSLALPHMRASYRALPE